MEVFGLFPNPVLTGIRKTSLNTTLAGTFIAYSKVSKKLPVESLDQ
jgi:hypothetical protein